MTELSLADQKEMGPGLRGNRKLRTFTCNASNPQTADLAATRVERRSPARPPEPQVLDKAAEAVVVGQGTAAVPR